MKSHPAKLSYDIVTIVLMFVAESLIIGPMIYCIVQIIS
jgi:hypothetical protein